jgi:hypothetical protein
VFSLRAATETDSRGREEVWKRRGRFGLRVVRQITRLVSDNHKRSNIHPCQLAATSMELMVMIQILAC